MLFFQLSCWTDRKLPKLLPKKKIKNVSAGFNLLLELFWGGGARCYLTNGTKFDQLSWSSKTTWPTLIYSLFCLNWTFSVSIWPLFGKFDHFLVNWTIYKLESTICVVVVVVFKNNDRRRSSGPYVYSHYT